VTAPAEEFPFVVRAPELDVASLAPMLPITLVASKTVEALGLLDTGAAVNVLPHAAGVELGLDWNQQTTRVLLSGNLAAVDARAIVVTATVGRFVPVRMAFAWANVDTVPVILGQINFFLEFDVCFSRSRRIFEVRRAERP
jgi:hypothetical protein